MHQLLLLKLLFEKSKQSTDCLCTGSVELHTLFSALCTPEPDGYETNIYLTHLPYLANTKICYSSPKSVKQQRGIRDISIAQTGTISPMFSCFLCKQLSVLSCYLLDKDSYFQFMPA